MEGSRMLVLTVAILAVQLFTYNDGFPIIDGCYPVITSGYALYGLNNRVIKNESVENCFLKCMDETKFDCISFDYNPWARICYLSESSKDLEPNHFGVHDTDDYYDIVCPVTTRIPPVKSTPKTTTQQTCMTTECVVTAARLINAINTEVDPCDDFYEYACGNWKKKNPIPDDETSISSFGKLIHEVQYTVKRLIESPVSDDELPVTVKTKHVYQSCMNMDLIEERGDSPLHDYIEYLGGWPVLNAEWNCKQYDWTELIVKPNLHSDQVFISLHVGADARDSNNSIITIYQGSVGLYRAENDTVEAYQQFATDIAILLGAPKERAVADMADAIQFEKKLANIITPLDEREDEILHVHELYTNITEDINWIRYLNLIFQNIDYTITMDHEINVWDPRYFTKLAQLLRDTSSRTITNYVVWRGIQDKIKNLDQRYLDVLAKFREVAYEVDSESARWRDCSSYTQSMFGMAVGRLYVMKKFPESAKTDTIEMIGNIRQAFKDILDEVEWLDDKTREVVREKVDAIVAEIGYPDEILNTTLLNAMYEEYTVYPDKYFENVLNHLYLRTLGWLKPIRKDADKHEWILEYSTDQIVESADKMQRFADPTMVNAFYSPSSNRIMFPAGILNPPFYHKNYPKSLNYGGIGAVIGHEITHGFDNNGRQYDKDGNHKKWWSDDIIEKFKTQAQCIIDQYSDFTVPEIDQNLNGTRTQGENIADNGGVKQSFRAYRDWVETQGREEELLPGINFNHNQLFFLNFAQIWCANARPKTFIDRIKYDVHSPGKYRVLGVVSNMYEFAETFQCPIGSKMNPEKKCSVW